MWSSIGNFFGLDPEYLTAAYWATYFGLSIPHFRLLLLGLAVYVFCFVRIRFNFAESISKFARPVSPAFRRHEFLKRKESSNERSNSI